VIGAGDDVWCWLLLVGLYWMLSPGCVSSHAISSSEAQLLLLQSAIPPPPSLCCCAVIADQGRGSRWQGAGSFLWHLVGCTQVPSDPACTYLQMRVAPPLGSCWWLCSQVSVLAGQGRIGVSPPFSWLMMLSRSCTARCCPGPAMLQVNHGLQCYNSIIGRWEKRV